VTVADPGILAAGIRAGRIVEERCEGRDGKDQREQKRKTHVTVRANPDREMGTNEDDDPRNESRNGLTLPA